MKKGERPPAVPSEPHRERPAAKPLRTDIQGLRAIAVAMVVAYHLEHSLLPGGYVGVDVFFVISGFLITTHLLRKPPSRPSDFGDFWSRRIRRLLPASLLVLGVTLILVRLFAPDTQWANTARDARAATLYVVNWSLAGDAVDYLALDNLPTAVQHFWSLSVEEQFYFGWPMLVGAVAALARWSRRAVRVPLSLSLAAVIVASLTISVWYTAANPSAAYFITPTRIWELGLGGFVAVVTGGGTFDPERRRARSAVLRAIGSWVGLATIAIAGVAYSSSTPFPGYQAALPVLGTALVIICMPGLEDRFSPGRLLAIRPMQWLGDISYSVYLWHWPLIVLAPWMPVPHSRLVEPTLVLAATLFLGAATEHWVERPFRFARPEKYRKVTYLAAACAMVIVAGGASLQMREVTTRAEASRLELRSADHDGRCFGAEALDPGSACPPAAYADVIPAPAIAEDDRSEAYKDVGGRDCWSHAPNYPTRVCSFGADDASVRVALFGNSHAGHWLPALQRLADEHGWRVDTYLASQCASARVPQRFAAAAATDACEDWVTHTTAEIIADDPTLVVMSNRVSVGVVGHDLAGSMPLYSGGYAHVLGQFQEAGLPVAAIRDTPAPGDGDPPTHVPTCVAERGDSYSECDGTRTEWLPEDPVVAAARRLAGDAVRVIDLTDRICQGEACGVVNGGVLTYFDRSHLTATYAATLAPYLYPHLATMMSR